MVDRNLSFAVTILARADVEIDPETGETKVVLTNASMSTLGSVSGGEGLSAEDRNAIGTSARLLAIKYAYDNVTGKHEATSFSPNVAEALA